MFIVVSINFQHCHTISAFSANKKQYLEKVELLQGPVLKISFLKSNET